MIRIMAVLFIVLVTSACSGINDKTGSPANNQPKTSQDKTQSQSSFPYPLIVWNNQQYKATIELIHEVDREIGKILNYSTDEPADTPDNFSNYFKKGTKLWSIKNVDTKQAIAVEVREGKYLKAVLP
ncbi:hypothetical protein [Paenibacillus pinihumi]|uniref:hypothetical protein n=1 Tax=Paenibacillus pinihumi TaxID=669462 RepID=UPI0003F5A770|nr:hypothetical protein [Paenibacillus pinihumi]